jgi:diguanylate cyclase (GGDEF)-like protein
MRVYEIPEGNKTSKGRAIQNLINIPQDDKVKAYVKVLDLTDKEYVENNFIVMCSKQGVIKKTSLAAYSRPRSNGINAITIRENDELLEAYALLQQLVTVDPLTRLENRRSLMDFAEVQLKLSQRYKSFFSIMLIDLDYFKKINDTYGHLVGDEILKNIAKILKDILRNVDHIGRFGGEEFIVILPSTNLKNAVITAEKIRGAIANFVHNIEEQIIQTTVSIGIASYNPLDDDVNQIITRADQALYQAKSSGRNCSITE